MPQVNLVINAELSEKLDYLMVTHGSSASDVLRAGVEELYRQAQGESAQDVIVQLVSALSYSVGKLEAMGDEAKVGRKALDAAMKRQKQLEAGS